MDKFDRMDYIVNDILKILAGEAPISLQDSYDNAGLIVGHPEQTVRGVLVSIDVTEEVVKEAIDKGCDLIVSHHPLIFKGLKSLVPSGPVERTLLLAIMNNIAIASAHTNLDNVAEGVNGKIAAKLRLNHLQVLVPKTGVFRKIVVYCPLSHAEQVREAMFAAGAGQIGNYDNCSFNSEGFGTFRAGKDADPFVGSVNQLHQEPEVRIESIVPSFRLQAVVNQMLSVHPYEEVAYDLFPVENNSKQIGSGLIGYLDKPLDEAAFLDLVQTTFGTPCLRHTAFTTKPIHKVAVCGGSGAFLLKEAVRLGADAFVTADVKYHDFFEADRRLLYIDAGHFETEQFTKELICDIIQKKIPTFAPSISEVKTNPVQYYFKKK